MKQSRRGEAIERESQGGRREVQSMKQGQRGETIERGLRGKEGRCSR